VTEAAENEAVGLVKTEARCAQVTTVGCLTHHVFILQTLSSNACTYIGQLHMIEAAVSEAASLDGLQQDVLQVKQVGCLANHFFILQALSSNACRRQKYSIYVSKLTAGCTAGRTGPLSGLTPPHILSSPQQCLQQE
jgi:hypothetical protein